MDYSGKIIRKNPVVPSQTSASGVWTVDEALQATKNNSWPVANVPDPISRSLRFRASATAYLSRTPATTTNQKTFTWSSWNKLGALGTYRSFFSSATTNPPFVDFSFQNNDVIQLDIRLSSGTYQPKTTAVFRDPSAWYHIVVAVDTTQATEANRVKLYINGVQQTLSTVGVPQNSDLPVNTTVVHNIGRRAVASDSYFDGYMTEINFIDGQALTPSSFGGTNAITGVWEPRQYTGTYGTNGFLLTFSDNTSTATLGKDTSGNSNNWTTNNISLTAGATYDSMLDVPTQWIGYTTGNVADATRGNYATFNPILYMGTGSTKSNGNLTFAGGGTGGPPYNYSIYSTFTQNTGKWYWEVTITTAGSQPFVGMFNTAINFTGTSLQGSAGPVLYGYDGNYYNETSGVAFGATYTTGDVIGVAVDYDNNLIWFSKNGTFQNSGVPATGTNGKTFGSGKTWGTGYVESGSSVSASTFNINFGQRPFSYTPPAGFLSLCTTNLPSPTILQGNQYFDATLYTGTGATQTITNAGGVQPDLVWVKVRSTTGTHILTDSVRGANKQLFSNLTNAEASATNKITGFTSTGFTLGADDGSGTGDANFNGSTYVGWQWRASGSTVSNTAGSITSTVSVNTTAGFSIGTFTSPASGTCTVGHGLGVTPAMTIVKCRTIGNSAWFTWHQALGDNNTDYVMLQSTAAEASFSTMWGTVGRTSTLLGFTQGGSLEANASHVFYAFAAVPGYSAFGSYTGNGSSTDGPFVYTGFRPRYIMFKGTSLVSSWLIYDTARSTINPVPANGGYLLANSSAAEAGTGDSAAYVDILSNGFKIRNNSGFDNNSGSDTYIYMAFAENPFKNALAR